MRGEFPVSILTRPEGRVLPHLVPDPGNARRVSILTRLEGRVLLMIMSGWPQLCRFQSSPDPKAGCYPPHARGLLHINCFNPHPTRRPGATIRFPMYWTLWAFQSSPDPKAGCYGSYALVKA